MTKFSIDNLKVGVIGLGYVGLPIAYAFGKHFDVVGYDKNVLRITQLSQGVDITGEVDPELLSDSGIKFTTEPGDLKDCNFYIISVPTPINKFKVPDISILLNVSETIGKYIAKNDVVVYESTVYPGCTEEDCVPVLEKFSNLKFNIDFYCGYSPERINPGDKNHTIETILKVTSGSNAEVADFVDNVYARVISAGTFKAKSIKVAEAAKVIENTQRDVNIALINEFTKICGRLDIDVHDVIETAATKWNFQTFKPGLVGGHCIGVDPYYLSHKAQLHGYTADLILAARAINDSMASYYAFELLKVMIKESVVISNSRVLILGLTFKEDCPDLRNTKVVDLISEISEFGSSVDIYDPYVRVEEFSSLNVRATFVETLVTERYDAIVIAVPHTIFKEYDVSYLCTLTNGSNVIFDIKNFLGN
ncbi:nucleotide sugar dehydrogenase [Gammaproteobacteria bacterium]|nr:nucleotide sugar dehydrogenase [Gammaproteobacteria bacterium]